LSDLADEILPEIQSISVDELDLKPIGAEISIPREEVEAEVNRIADAASTWEEAFTLFGVDGPPSGRVESNEELVAELGARHPLTVLIPRQVLGAYGSLVFEAKDPDEQRRVELAQQEATRIRFWALLATDKIAAVVAKFGIPQRDQLERFFTTDLIDAELGARLADGTLRYLDGDNEAALHVLVPQLEAAIRELAARAGVSVIKNPQGGEAWRGCHARRNPHGAPRKDRRVLAPVPVECPRRPARRQPPKRHCTRAPRPRD
jgi:hypothetical protein